MPTRTVQSAKNPRYGDAKKETVVLDVVFAELSQLGAIPFRATVNDAEPHGQELYAAAVNGDFGTIAAYVAPAKK